MYKRLEFHGKQIPYKEAEAPIPEAPPNGMVIKAQFCGVCHSDAHIWQNPVTPPGLKHSFPFCMGHEVSGQVHSIGTGTAKGAADFKVGDRVMLFAWGGCRNCPVCEAGDQNCRHRNGAGVHQYGVWVDGGYQEYVAVLDRSMVLPVPEGLPMEVAALLTCGGVTAYNGVAEASVGIDKAIGIYGSARLLVIGAGGLGHWGIKTAKAKYGEKVSVTVVDISEEKVEEGVSVGADIGVTWGIEDSAEDAAQKVVAKAGGAFNAIIDFVNMPSTVERAFHASDNSCTIVLAGIFSGPMPGLPLARVALKNLHIQGIYTAKLSQLKELVDLVTKRKISGPKVTFIGMDKVNDAIQDIIKGNVKGRYVVKYY